MNQQFGLIPQISDNRSLDFYKTFKSVGIELIHVVHNYENLENYKIRPISWVKIVHMWPQRGFYTGEVYLLLLNHALFTWKE